MVGDAGEQFCAICQRRTRFSIILQYSFAHVYYVFGSLSTKRYYQVCDRCGNGEKVSGAEIPYSARDPALIPFMHRWGCVVGILCAAAAFGLLIATVYILEARDKQKNRRGRAHSAFQTVCTAPLEPMPAGQPPSGY